VSQLIVSAFSATGIDNSRPSINTDSVFELATTMVGTVRKASPTNDGLWVENSAFCWTSWDKLSTGTVTWPTSTMASKRKWSFLPMKGLPKSIGIQSIYGFSDGAMECPHGGGDRFIEAHFGVLLQVGDAPSLARLQKWRCLIS